MTGYRRGLWIVLLTLALPASVMAEPAGAANAVHHTVKIDVDPAKGRARVHDVLAIDGSGEIVLRLSRAFTLDSVRLNGDRIKVGRDDETVTLDLGASRRHTLELVYIGGASPFLDPEGGLFEPSWLAHPDDRLATWTAEVRTPADQKAVMAGKLSFETDDEKGYTAGFENATPGPPPVLITGPFRIREKIANGVRIRTYFHAELAPLAEDYLEHTARYIAYYADKVGPYPYPGFSIISGPAPVGWGLPGMTYMGRRVLKLPFIRYTSLPHEVLHNWWGNAVEVDYGKGNWAEGLTTYMADHAMAEAVRPGGGAAKRMEWLRNYAALPPERDRAVSQFRSKTHDASQVVGYGKTAFVFHMLNTLLGADAFDKALRRFNRKNHLKTADWGDIQAAFESESGQDLEAFFDAWVERPGAPDLQIRDAVAEGHDVKLVLEQAQDGPVYPLHVSVALETRDEGKIVNERHAVTMTAKRQSFAFNAKAPVTKLAVDPDVDVFRRLNLGEIPPILRDVTLDPDTRLVELGDIKLRERARDLAHALLQARLRMLSGDDDARTFIVAGPQELVRAYIAEKDLPPTPQDVDGKGDARAWMARSSDGRTWLFVEADTPAAFEGLIRVLPHYKRRSYVVMERGRTLNKGTWTPQTGPLTVRFD